MAYVPGFKYDLFISYASDDLDDKLKGLIQDLRVYLRRELGKDFPLDSIFFDREELHVKPTQWKQKLRESAGSAALLVPVLTPSYAGSDYCAKEWEWFREADLPLKWEAGVENFYRLCPVRWRELDVDTVSQLPDEIRSAQEQRSLSVENLGAVISNGLRLMRRSRQTVYVGETEHEIRTKVRNEISRMGFRVTPDVAMAFESPEVVCRLLGDAKLAVHFVGHESSPRAIKAIRSSREYCQFGTIVYEIPGVELSEEEDLLLQWLEEDLRRLEENLRPASVTDLRVYDRISGKKKNVDQFLEVIRDRLERERPLPQTRLGIAYEDLDRSAVESIIPEICSKTRFSVTPYGMLDLLELKRSRGILFYWGEAEGDRLLRAREPLRGANHAFFFAPPPKSEESKTKLAGCEIFHQKENRFHIDDIRPFLERLGWKG